MATGNQSALDTRIRVIYGAILAATIAVPVILAAIRVSVGQTGTEGPARILGILAPALAVAAAIASVVIRSRMPHRRQILLNEWWKANMRWAVILWSLAEGVGMLAGVSYFLTGRMAATLLAFGVAIALLLIYAPGRLAE